MIIVLIIENGIPDEINIFVFVLRETGRRGDGAYSTMARASLRGTTKDQPDGERKQKTSSKGRTDIFFMFLFYENITLPSLGSELWVR